MLRPVVFWSLIASVALGAARLPAQSHQTSNDRLVLITLDGARTEEIFGGLDLAVLTSTLKKDQRAEDQAVYRRFWADSADGRRRKLMPFFWSLVSEHGSIAGNRVVGSAVTLQNRHWFSYPGYAEILLGEAHDLEIASNDPVRNPFPTVLEGLRESLHLGPDHVATFASWGVFNAIAEHVEGAITVNAGAEPYDDGGTDARLMNTLQIEATTPWEGTRFDAFTFHLAMKYLNEKRPRVLYLAFDETDDWAHDGRYDRVLDAYNRIDGYLRLLWAWLQSQPDYRGRTHLLITTDHGRGHSTADWRNHGADVAGAEDVWIAFVSPRMPRRGEWRDAPTLHSSQIAATVAGWLGVDWTATHPAAGKAIQ
jgi:hypothetical protein